MNLNKFRRNLVPCAARFFSETATKPQITPHLRPSRPSMNLKQATVLSEFQGLPLMKLAKQNAAEPKYDVKQAMHKLTSTTWTNSEQLMKFYESNRDLYTSKPKDNQELSDVMALYRSQLENLRKVSY